MKVGKSTLKSGLSVKDLQIKAGIPQRNVRCQHGGFSSAPVMDEP